MRLPDLTSAQVEVRYLLLPPGLGEDSKMSINVSLGIERKLIEYTKSDNMLRHWLREDESRIYICLVFRTRIATNTSDSHSRQNSAAFLKSPLLRLCRC